MKRLALSCLAVLALTGCAAINWQEGYNNAARRDCQAQVSQEARLACLDRVEENASEKRAAQRT